MTCEAFNMLDQNGMMAAMEAAKMAPDAMAAQGGMMSEGGAMATDGGMMSSGDARASGDAMVSDQGLQGADLAAAPARMGHGHRKKPRGHQNLCAPSHGGQHLPGVAKGAVEPGRHFGGEDGHGPVALAVVLPQPVGIGDTGRLDRNGGQAGGLALVPMLGQRGIGVEGAGFVVVLVLVGTRLFRGRVAGIFGSSSVVVVMPLCRSGFQPVQVPDCLNRYQNGAVPGRAAGLQPSGDAAGHRIMDMAAWRPALAGSAPMAAALAGSGLASARRPR